MVDFKNFHSTDFTQATKVTFWGGIAETDFIWIGLRAPPITSVACESASLKSQSLHWKANAGLLNERSSDAHFLSPGKLDRSSPTSTVPVLAQQG